MTVNGYFLRGSEDELLMVIKTDSEDLVYQLINKIAQARDKELKELAKLLEKSLYEQQYRNGTRKAQPKNQGARANRTRRVNRKTTDS